MYQVNGDLINTILEYQLVKIQRHFILWILTSHTKMKEINKSIMLVYLYMYLPEIMFFENFSIQNNSRKICEKRHDTCLYK